MTFLRLNVLRTLWHTSAVCVIYSNLKGSSRPKNRIKSLTFSCDFFYNFRRGLTQQQCIDKLNSIFGDDAPSYGEIETTLGISGASIHLILHEYLIVKKICSRWIPHSLSIAQKRPVSMGRKKCCKNTTGDESWIFPYDSESKQKAYVYGCYKMSQIQQKLVANVAFLSKWSPVFSEKLSQLYH